MPLPKRFPDRDEVVAVRAEAETLEPDQEAGTTRRLAGRVMARTEVVRQEPDTGRRSHGGRGEQVAGGQLDVRHHVAVSEEAEGPPPFLPRIHAV